MKVPLKLPRLRWGRKPQTKVKQSDKIYDRNRAKDEGRKEEASKKLLRYKTDLIGSISGLKIDDSVEVTTYQVEAGTVRDGNLVVTLRRFKYPSYLCDLTV